MSTVALRAEGLTRTYRSGETVITAVADADLEVMRGELVVVMGPSGAGKTTLLSLVGGLLPPSEGRIWLDGTEITALDERRLPAVRLSKVGFVFQGFNLLANLTARENVRVVLEAAGVPRREADRRARAALVRLGLDHRLDQLPEVLSGGEKQRVAIARAVVHTPVVVLADEPTGNLDSSTGRQVMLILRELVAAGDRAVVCVTHDHRVLDVADRVLWLEDGQLSQRPLTPAPEPRSPEVG